MLTSMKTKINHYVSPRKILAAAGLLLLIIAGLTHVLAAQTLTQGYSSDQPLERGMLVLINKKDTKKVEPVTVDTEDQMHGVVVGANDAPVTLSSQGQNIFVATTGHFEVLVSTQNGPISIGDYIVISALQGIGMKADTTQAIVIGKALTAFDGKNGAISSAKIKDSTGADKTVAISRVTVDINVARNPLAKPLSDNLPDVLRKVSSSIAQKPVSAARVYTGLVVVLVTAAVCGSMLFAGIRTTITAIGRNPLSKKSVIRSLIQVILSGLIVFAIGLFGVYLLLKF